MGFSKITGNPLSQSGFKGQKRNLIMNSINLKLSKYDLRRGLKLPDKMTRELAEETGIHVGDGCICRYINNKGFPGYKYIITSGGNEKDYMEKYLIPLIEKVYGIKTKARLKNDGSLEANYDSKNLVKFKMLLGLPLGKKGNIKIPKVILNSNFIKAFLRGLMDTDGSLCFLKKYKKVHYYPRLAITSKSKKLILQVNRILRRHAFKTTLSLDSKSIASNGTECITNRVTMNGKDNLRKWIDLIGFSNPKNIRKLEEWNRKGFIEKRHATGGI